MVRRLALRLQVSEYCDCVGELKCKSRTKISSFARIKYIVNFSRFIHAFLLKNANYYCLFGRNLELDDFKVLSN